MALVHVITYATKSFGMFEDLIHNDFGIDVKVLGMGEKWTGFKGKLMAIRDYIKELPLDDIVIILDGFDTKVNGTLDEAIKRFKSLHKNIVMSQGYITDWRYTFIKHIFGNCNSSGTTANAGLYMGYVKYVQQLLDDASRFDCQDDQRSFNTLCSKHEIYVDTDKLIFHNNPPSNSSSAIFIGFPGTLNPSRILRMFKEYTQFFRIELLLVLSGLLIFMKDKVVLPVTIVLLIVWLYCDFSCIRT